MSAQSKITPCLWFNFNAEEAVHHYTTIFRRSRILEVSHYGNAMPQFKGRVLTILFELEGQRLQALNGGPQYHFTEAISLSVDCVPTRQKWTSCGRASLKAARKASAPG